MNQNCCSTMELQKTHGEAPATATDQIARAVPAVDIIETEEGVTLWADMPGVTREGLEIVVEKGLLTLSGRVERAAEPGHLLHDENTPTDYQRRFQIGQELNEAGIAAELKDGVLKVYIPKAEQARPRKIEIKTA